VYGEVHFRKRFPALLDLKHSLANRPQPTFQGGRMKSRHLFSPIFYRGFSTRALLLAACLVLTLTSIADAQQYRYFGTQLTDWSVFTFPTTGGQIRWRILKNENPSQPPGIIHDIPFGQTATDEVPNQGDYTGDGIHDLALYRDHTGTPANTYIIQRSSGGIDWLRWGNFVTDYVGAEGDYDGDGRMDLTAVRVTPAFQWWVLRSSNNTVGVFIFGNDNTDIALPGADYTGDGVDDPAVARVALNGLITWIVGTTTGAQLSQVTWGNFNTDFIVPAGDYDGDLKADYMVWRGFGAVDGIWYLRTSSGSVSYTRLGIPGSAGVRDTALRSGDYDGDGLTDIALYRPSTLTFYVLRSSGGVQTQVWGVPGNTNLPIAAFGVF
jgi:hypothetical protein